MKRSLLRAFRASRWVAAVTSGLLLVVPGCGSGGGGGTNTGGPRLVLIHFLQAGEDNVPLNRVLEFHFSAQVDPASVGPDSIQIRSGPSFGEAVEGRYLVQGANVFFEPRLPGQCSLDDAGFGAGTDYRVTIIGSPEEFAVRSTTGAPLEATINFSFRTRLETDPAGLFEDQVPGAFPTVVSTTPADGARPPLDPAVNIGPNNRVVIDFSENIDPCSISATSVRFNQYATGNPADFPNGFNPDNDQTPGDPYTWGSGTPTSPPQRIRSSYTLTQTLLSTRLVITPDFGEFPDNALLVVELTSDIEDFGGNPLIPHTFAFVTENRPQQCSSRLLRFDGDVPIDSDLTTADVDTARAPDRAQGFLLFAGDGDNGTNPNVPSGPACAPYLQANDGSTDDFDTVSSDVVLDTGATPNTVCNNTTDGSRAVVFEYRTFRIRSGRTVRIVGRNPAIILVSGDVLIESGGRLLVKSDGGGGYPTANGTGGARPPQATGAAGGTGVAGGGSGGAAVNGGGGPTGTVYGNNGEPGFGSPDYGMAPGMGGGDPVLVGPGRGAVSLGSTGSSATPQRNAPGGGGGGHATAGAAGQANGSGTSPRFLEGGGVADGAGGGVYGDPSGSMPTAEAGSGGGGGGYARAVFSGTSFAATGGGAGAGGGFVDLTAGGTIKVFGTIDASGGMGGPASGSFYGAAGGGGGGSGGGVRLLTPSTIELAATTVITAGGGSGGGGAVPSGSTAPANAGGIGGFGRLVFEDEDSVITNQASASLAPSELSPGGFYRGVFDASRFQGGGLTPQVVTGLIDMGPTFPTYLEPVQVYGGQEDFVAGVPAVASRGIGKTSILFEVQGFPANPDGSPNMTAPSGWKRIGYFTDSGSETFPTWNAGTPPPADVTPPSGGAPGGFAAVDGREFVQFRITFYLKSDVGPFDPGPYVDDWNLHFCYDQ